MAEPETATSEDESAAAGACMPCRATGRVTSFLGGEASEETCPWCGGTGERTSGIDAQARWLPEGPAVASADVA